MYIILFLISLALKMLRYFVRLVDTFFFNCQICYKLHNFCYLRVPVERDEIFSNYSAIGLPQKLNTNSFFV